METTDIAKYMIKLQESIENGGSQTLGTVTFQSFSDSSSLKSVSNIDVNSTNGTTQELASEEFAPTDAVSDMNKVAESNPIVDKSRTLMNGRSPPAPR